MALKTSSAVGLQQRGIRRRYKPHVLLSMRRKNSKLAARLMAVNAAGYVERQTGKQNLQDHSNPSSPATTPEPTQRPDQNHISTDNKATLQHMFGRYFDENDRSAADILATLYLSGLLEKKPSGSEPASSSDETDFTPAASPRSSVALHEDNVQPSVIALPSMQQTNIMLESWRSENGRALTSNGKGDDPEDMDLAVESSSYPMTPALSSSASSARSSFSVDSPVQGPPPPPYDTWRKSIANGDGSHIHRQLSPFATYENNYFSSPHDQSLAGRNGMPSPPQSPTDTGRSTEYCFNTGALPTPPLSYAATMQQEQEQHQHQYQRRHGDQQMQLQQQAHGQSYVGQSQHMDRISTTVVTLPPPVAAREPLTPVSPLTLSGAFVRGRGSPKGITTTKVDKKERLSTSPAKKAAPLPKPHCNVKYETAELDFIMYQRTTKNRAWDDVTASFNAALPRLRQYAEMDYAHLGGAGAGAGGDSSSGGNKAATAIDRYRPRPERTTPGLQASYYRQRLALPLLDEAGQLVFDAQTGKQMFTEVMVRDDKSRKKMRRLSSINGGSTYAGSNSNGYKPGAVSPDDTRVHLVLYFPERVAYYDYWFVSEEDKALARQRAYERNMQRTQRGLPAWQPGSDDPESGILIRSKEA